jgi:hypothetical protein
MWIGQLSVLPSIASKVHFIESTVPASSAQCEPEMSLTALDISLSI